MNGHAVGAGLCFAIACDYRVALNEAKYGFNFTRLGLHPGMGSTHFLPQLIGYEKAFRLLTSGELISGDAAHEIGLCGSLGTSHEEVMENAFDKASLFQKTSGSTVRQVLRTLRARFARAIVPASPNTLSPPLTRSLTQQTRRRPQGCVGARGRRAVAQLQLGRLQRGHRRRARETRPRLHPKRVNVRVFHFNGTAHARTRCAPLVTRRL